jgi:hypothetical protein
MAKPRKRAPVKLSPEEEEQEAKRKLKAAEARKKAAAQRSEAGRAAIIKEIQANARARNAKCSCPVKPTMTLEEILRVKTCTESVGGRGPGWICPVTDAIRRRLGH